MSRLSFWKVLTRKKTLPHEHETETHLSRVLSTYDLTALGVGATLGVGVYVLAGHVAKNQAGPSVVISFLIAALASLLAGLCYAEFGARVPKAGSAYVYSYVCVGEFAAFVIGWNLMLEYIIGAASVCRGISLYLDNLINDVMKTTFSEIAPIEWSFVGTYFDFFAFALAILFGGGLVFGIQASAFLNNFCTIINVGVVIFVVIAGSIKANFHNWDIDPDQVNKTILEPDQDIGVGGFFPFGFEGTLRGAATCFFGFVGFDCIATTGEEVRDPRKAIPRAILYSLLIIFLAYFGISTVLTLMWPYYLQDINAPIPYAFEQVGWSFAKWIITIGGMLGFIASLLGALFPLPRIIYSMAQDGLLFRCLGVVHSKFKTPVIGTICSAILTGVIAGIFDLTQLVNMLSIGTLLAYTVIAICLTILRYMDNSVDYENTKNTEIPFEGTNLVNRNRTTCYKVMLQFFNLRGQTIPSCLSTAMVTIMLLVFCFSTAAFGLTLMNAYDDIMNLVPWSVSLLTIFGLIDIFIVISISCQPREEESPYFKVPLVPLVPAISIFINIYLMLQLDLYTWIRFGIWMIIGFLIYIPCIYLYDRKKISHLNEKRSNYFYIRGDKSITELEIEKSDYNTKPLENGDIILSLKNELDQNSNEITELNNNSSIKRSLDDIVLESEITESLKEMKHSNGDKYLIEHNEAKSIEPENDLSSANNDTKDDTESVLEILDNVLLEEDIEKYELNRQMSFDSQHTPSFHNVSTAVIVHRPSDGLIEEIDNENEISNNVFSESKDSGIEQDRDIFKESEICLTETETKDCNLKDNIIQDDETSMATANVALVDLKEKSSNSRPNSETGINEILIPGSNLLISSPKVSKASKNEKNNANYIDETPRPSILSELINKNKVLTGSGQNCDNLKDENLNAIIMTPQTQTSSEKNVDSSPRVSPVLGHSKSPSNLSRNSSTTSNKSYKNPLHSASFKQKLIKLMAPNIPSKQKKKQEITNKPAEDEVLKTKITIVENNIEKSLKSSKSEPNIAHMVLTTVETDKNESVNDEKNEKVNLTEASKTINENKIPKPPKFDPILYKSLGANYLHHSKTRPKLDNLIAYKKSNQLQKNSLKNDNQFEENDKVNQDKLKEKNNYKSEEENYTPEQFKKKLAALIQRGPSFKSQQNYPPVNGIKPILKNNKNFTENDKNAHKNNYASVLKSINDSKNSKNSSESKDSKIMSKTDARQLNGIRNSKDQNKILTKTNKESIDFNDVRKSLKPIN